MSSPHPHLMFQLDEKKSAETELQFLNTQLVLVSRLTSSLSRPGIKKKHSQRGENLLHIKS